MANPKRRHSKARRDRRRTHDNLPVTSVSRCPQCHGEKMSHRVCPNCGFYKGREVVEVPEV